METDSKGRILFRLNLTLSCGQGADPQTEEKDRARP
jgi:hypothetical protein